MSRVTKEFQYGQHVVRLETGRIARQATGAVMVTVGNDTMVLVTAVGVVSSDDATRDFFPLTVNYQERSYAAGKIPGGFFKREGRPSENETLVSRLIDRPLRPLFPKAFASEVQVIATVMSLDPEINPDIASIIGASAALAISGMPFNGPLGAARVGYKDGKYLLNPTLTEMATSELDLVVAGTEHAVLMVESEAKELSEKVMLGAVVFGHEEMQVAIKAIKEFADEVGTESWGWQPPAKNANHSEDVRNKSFKDLAAAYEIQEKTKRRTRLDEIRADAKTFFIDNADANVAGEKITDQSLANIISDFESEIVRGRILDGQPRIDGRDTKTIRNIAVEVGIIPRAHGSALFTRGETQAIVVATLGTERDAQIIDALEGERRDNFMLHYNFPPYSVGEVGFVGSPKRREIGHGRLARRAAQAVIPSMEDFPYVLRVVSEITESNGSSSMASVCGTSLALMDAGVPISNPVAGIAMGLIKEGDRFAILSDILGDEDHLGDMDFKVAGTDRGVTALQMDIKIEGITKEIMDIALNQAREGRIHILGKMAEGLSRPRAEISMFAPRIITIRIDPEKIRDVIGKGGVTIRALTEETGAVIDITDDGVVKIAAINSEAGLEAKRRIELITATAEVGKIYSGRVVKIVDFGAFVNFLPGKDGLVHISQISTQRIENVADVLSEGQEISVKVMEIDRQGRIRLSIKDAVEEVVESV